MKVIKPSVIADVNLYSSTVSELSNPEDYYTFGGSLVAPLQWLDSYATSGAPSYALGARVWRAATHRIYEVLDPAGIPAGRTVKPENDIDGVTTSPKWLQVGPTNKWAMFDGEIASATKDGAAITVVLNTSQINSVALFGLVGSSVTVTLRDSTNTTVLYTATKNLEGVFVDNWYDYFFSEFRQIDLAVFTDLPVYYAAKLTIEVTGTNVQIGQAVVGYAYFIGETEYGSSSGIIDYSKKEANTFGNVTFITRAFSKRMSAKLWLQNTSLDYIQSKLAEVRATPCVWVGTEDTTYNNLVVYGFYKDFTLEVTYPTTSSCSLEIEGLI